MNHILRIWDHAGMPMTWVIEDETAGELWMVPAVPNGWQKRTPYRGFRASLRSCSGYNFCGLGVPLRRSWPEVCRDKEGRN